ncbi:hypothetical protein EDL99_09885 [Ornithobacterium rhinotracheale]|uniref:hypothetical protein n=1 Tax=Ornithobacterium rhinotracheale TaxID=28251 RepID=UPI00129C7A5C|nr:hypothetical protein [Ornithobacterium rhinotracheale]MRJ09166.1 hypothetical protein [Ornithobacterium rhinotracheale]UOH77248.1 hypothetical protein MT996_08500 [Ornithobacterium rhinotracheale]
METQAKAQKYLSEHESVPKIYSTADGFLFLRYDHAKAHAHSLQNKEVGQHLRAGEKGEEKPFDTLHGNLLEVKERIKNVNDEGLLEALILQEESEANRKTVLKLLANRIQELKKEE